MLHIGVLQSAEEPHVLVMAANPEPGYGVFVKDSNRAVGEGHSDRPDVLGIIDAFET